MNAPAGRHSPTQSLRWRIRAPLLWAILVEVYFLSGITLSSPDADARFALGRLLLLLGATLLGALTLRGTPALALPAFALSTLVAAWLLLDIALTVPALAAQLLGTAILLAGLVALSLVVALVACTVSALVRWRHFRAQPGA